MYTDKKVKLINYLIALIPLSLILGNLIVNANIILICLIGLLIFKKEVFFIKKKDYQIFIYLFFFYIVLTTLINNLPNIGVNSLYLKNIFKSFFFLRFFLIFLIFNKLIETNSLNLKPFFYSASFFSIIISIDLIIQVIYGKNLLGFEISHYRPSSFFGDENIAGGYLQKFILFFIFFYAYKNKSDKKLFFIFLIFLIPIFLTGNRMPTVIFMTSILVYYLLEKKIKLIFFSKLFFFLLIYVLINFPVVKRTDLQIKIFFEDTVELLSKAPKLFSNNSYEEAIEFGPSGYLIHFNSGIKIWKKNKIFGNGIKSFFLNCKYGKNETCNTHPHNYFIELMMDTGLLGLFFIYSIFILALFRFLKLYFLKFNNNDKFLSLPFFFIVLFEFFPFRSTGSFFSTSNSIVIFLVLSIFINIEKIKYFYKK